MLDIFEQALTWVLPVTDDLFLRGQATIIIITCGSLFLALIGLMVVWRLSRDLERQTVGAFTVLMLLLVGIGASARAGNVALAAWALAIWLLASISFVVWNYGVAGLAANGYVLPIALIAQTLGFVPGLSVAVLSSVFVWVLAWGENAGWYSPKSGRDISHLTFNAPALTALFWVMAWVSGFWVEYQKP